MSGDGTMDGDPAEALQRFHQDLQREAIAAFQKTVDPQVWATMIARNFPEGIFPERKDEEIKIPEHKIDFDDENGHPERRRITPIEGILVDGVPMPLEEMRALGLRWGSYT